MQCTWSMRAKSRIKISRRPAGRVEHISKFIAAHSGGGPKLPSHESKGALASIGRSAVSPGDRKVTSITWTREVRQGPGQRRNQHEVRKTVSVGKLLTIIPLPLPLESPHLATLLPDAGLWGVGKQASYFSAWILALP